MRYIYFFAGLLFLSACAKSGAGNDSSTLAASTLTDVSYGTDAKQKLDIYLPAGRTDSSTKLIFLVHGGGWSEGDKADFTASVAYFQKLLPDYAFVNINYRLFSNGQNLFPAQENDVKSAADFIFNKRSEYKISAKWAFIGASAGAHLAMLQSYKYSTPVKPKAVVSFFGPSELISLYNSPNPLIALQLLNVTGTIPAINAGVYQQSSPYNFITAAAPPTLLLQGGMDVLVPPSQSTIVRDKLQLLGVPNQYVLYPNNGHGWDGPDLLDSYTKIVAFLNLHVK